ncbi:MAG: electron transfer flavoprotein subunit alpha/FixB family protein [Bacteroidales bacterium]|jgi:electron transfer flavoprotein alpha subunit|nr:electron transfer flavoprotein subunit alpha/FixB family protein [Bacteroidales bacterium]
MDIKNNVFVYCEITEEGLVADIGLELLSKGRKLANELCVQLEAIVLGNNLKNIDKQLFPYGVDVINIAEDERLFPYMTLPHFEVITHLLKKKQPEILLLGASSVGRDLAPRIASHLRCGLTADCTALEIGTHTENKTGKVYQNLLYQIRPAFGGNIIATIINPETRPQMATVREGVMKREIYQADFKGIVEEIAVDQCLSDKDVLVKMVKREIEKHHINIKNASIIVAGGYGMGSKENFHQLFDFADLVGGEVGATRAAVDAGFTEPGRQIGQTGITVRPKLYFAFGISGAIQHLSGMEESSKIISVNIDPNAPINSIADYTIVGNVNDVLPLMMNALQN